MVRPRIVVAAAVLVATGCAAADDTAEPSPSSPDASTTSVSKSEPTPTAHPLVDPCLIGRWKQVSMTQEWTIDGVAIGAEGWTGRILEFRADGTELVAYDDAAPITGEGPAGAATQTWSGTALYDVSTSGDTLTFHDVDFSDARITSEYDGEAQDDITPEGLSDPVTYTCDESAHTQRSDTYEASFSRVE